MKIALFVAEQKSPASNQDIQDWRNFVGTAQGMTAELSGVSTLNEGTFLCKLSVGLHPLSKLALCAKEWRVQSRTLFLDEEPSWVVSKIAAKDQ